MKRIHLLTAWAICLLCCAQPAAAQTADTQPAATPTAATRPAGAQVAATRGTDTRDTDTRLADEALLRRVDSLEQRLNRQASRAEKWERVLDKLPRISGYIQLLYNYDEAAEASSFSIKRVRLDLQGPLYRQWVDYRVQIEFASPKILDAYIRIMPWQALNFQIGQNKIPFSFDNVDYVPLKLATIDYPISLQKLMGFSDLCGIKATGRDMGVTLFGTLVKTQGRPVVEYRAGIYNGAGINCADNNKSKDISARLVVAPLAGLRLSASGYWGECLLDGQKYAERTRYAAGVAYDGDLFARAEYIRGKTGTVKSDGWYVTAGYWVTPKLAPVVRYDAFREVIRLKESHQADWLAGIDYKPFKNLRLQLNYTLRTYRNDAIKNTSLVQVMITGMFQSKGDK